jgi:hypothetical protein
VINNTVYVKVTKRLLGILVGGVLLTMSAAQASSPDAWAAFNAKVAKKCNMSSGLQQARSGEVVGFDDSLGKVVTLVTGISRQPRPLATTVTMLCIYDQRSGRAWITEATGWTSPDR